MRTLNKVWLENDPCDVVQVDEVYRRCCSKSKRRERLEAAKRKLEDIEQDWVDATVESES
jgi:hypothetical protein